MLFFPEEGDDYSAYLPVSNKNIAKLLNLNGDVVIDGKKVNLIDIRTYADLVNFKVTPPENNEFQPTRATSIYPLNGLPATICNNRKLWVVAYTRSGPNPAIAQEIVVSVRFRRKGFLGIWYNYREESRLSWEPGMDYRKREFSSHEYIWPRFFNSGVPAPFRGVMSVGLDDCGFNKNYFEVNL